ncbi:pseudouridine-metabolizing bifunctional protein C1861.05 isoform X2 [Belonocnema kinseyi]|uniref:pseudouridine-metabolizing bifunctional protein C1861.05 isoform X2 n=1 Tax=Belonocnema kinseyi TaxID=2817044 RepID=UPI00143DDD87|nr:pseudouridine-metabolizing bifunctional protein C1861.05 isoform X2 [Belonocnema kinseyi]XP_033232222.1 pseudouridine-metabolizing bifunctional protein C1861.05 isoform X2 [Belonocnema kinseyi]
MNIIRLTVRNVRNLKAVQHCRNFHRSAVRHTGKQDVFVYGSHVLEAMNNGLPIVALESTIITHGMPYPENLKTALQVEDAVRKNGAVPATIAILEGKVHIGINQDEIERLSQTPRQKVIKCSRRDFPFVISQKLNGSTTVCGTMLMAKQVGIQIMATGGIGGVHRGAEINFDVSADLMELSRTPVAVVCAGVKAILDIPKTLEYLETEGVPVVTLGDSNNFPAFYCRETFDKIKSPMRVSTSKEAAHLIRAQRKLNLNTGMLLAVPIPEFHALNPEEIEESIQKALKKANTKNIFGKEITPFLLQEIAELTAGRSVQANIALITNNAKVAAEIARNLTIENDYDHFRPYRLKGKPVVIGGAVFDTTLQMKELKITFNGSTHKGQSREACGGVGRNVASALINLGVDGTKLISVVGNDDAGKAVIQTLQEGADTIHILTDARTARFKFGNSIIGGFFTLDIFCRKFSNSVNGGSSFWTTILFTPRNQIKQRSNDATLREHQRYTAILDNNGECCFGIGEMEIFSEISSSLIKKHHSKLQEADLIVLDGNPPIETMRTVLDIAENYRKTVWYEPTDIHKALKIFEAGSQWKNVLHFVSPNKNELLAMARFFEIPMENEDFNNYETVRQVAERLAERIPVVITTLGPLGVLVVRKASKEDAFYDEKGRLIENEDIQSHLYPPLSQVAEKHIQQISDYHIVPQPSFLTLNE